MSRASTKKIGIIGRVDPERTLFDGQTVKTRMMYRLLCEMFGEQNLVVVDTIDYRERAVKVICETVRCLMTCDDVFVLLSGNGRRVLFPVLAFMVRVRGVRIYHNLIGGWLARNLDRYPKWIGYLNSFKVNWVEAHKLVAALSEKGVGNASYLPNFKYLEDGVYSQERVCGPDYRFCTFSRVMEKKGVGDAMRAVEQVAATYSAGRLALDIYGPVEDSYRAEFESLLDECPHSCYRGCVEPERSVATIVGYDALLFPTRWELEGIPGTIIDALAAGVPVIASRWGYYDEMLEDGVTGLSYEFDRQEQLPACIRHFIEVGDGVRRMGSACKVRAREYTPEVVAKEIRKVLVGR